jgi:hypothetical protein
MQGKPSIAGRLRERVVERESVKEQRGREGVEREGERERGKEAEGESG